MQYKEQLAELIEDPIIGPFEGEDYWFDEDGSIQIADNNAKVTGAILRKVNNSGIFPTKLVKIGQKGDNILLNFDNLMDVAPVYSARIGFQRDTLAEVKKDNAGKFCIYINKQRKTGLYKKLASAKQFLKRLDLELQDTATHNEINDD